MYTTSIIFKCEWVIYLYPLLVDWFIVDYTFVTKICKIMSKKIPKYPVVLLKITYESTQNLNIGD